LKKSVATVEPILKKRRQPLPPIVGKRVGTGRGRKFAARFLSFARRSGLNFGDQFVQLAQPREVMGPNAVEIVAPTLLNATLAEANIAGFAVEPNVVVPTSEPLCSNVFQTPINLVRAALYDASRKVPKNRNLFVAPLNLPILHFFRHLKYAPFFKLFKRRRFSADARRFNERAIHPFDFQTFQTSLFFRLQRRFQAPPDFSRQPLPSVVFVRNFIPFFNAGTPINAAFFLVKLG